MIYPLFTHHDGFIIPDKTWMHTPEALAKHYISYNAKVGEAVSLLLVSADKEEEKSFSFSAMLKRMSVLEWDNNAFDFLCASSVFVSL